MLRRVVRTLQVYANQVFEYRRGHGRYPILARADQFGPGLGAIGDGINAYAGHAVAFVPIDRRLEKADLVNAPDSKKAQQIQSVAQPTTPAFHSYTQNIYPTAREQATAIAFPTLIRKEMRLYRNDQNPSREGEIGRAVTRAGY